MYRFPTVPFALTVVIPTLNEAQNVVPLLERLDHTLQGIAWEALFVDDDSRDGTAELIRGLAQERGDVRVVQRIGRRGLASACIEGILASSSPYVAVMDADMQHDEAILPELLRKVRDEKYDIAVGSRNVGDGSMGEFSRARVFLSHAGRRLSQAVCRIPITDPMSGYFLMERQFAQKAARRSSGYSFKILVDLLSSSPAPPKWVEVPYRFRGRVFGESKLDTNTLLEFAILLIHKVIRGVVPARFVLFCLVGASGVAVHMAVLAALHSRHLMDFAREQGIATMCAMASNFWLNNLFTFRERRLKGWRILGGALTFFGVCTIGALASVGLGEWMRQQGAPWYVAGAFGTVIAAVWNFGVASVATWRVGRR